MKKFIGVAVLLCAATLLAGAQETPKPEVFGGYQFTTMDGGWHASGWNGQANFYVTRWLGIGGDFAGAYKTGSSLHTYTFGPVISTHRGAFSPFVHGLFGGAHASAAGVGDSGMAMLFGGGVDLGKKQIAVRLFQADWMIVRFNGITDKNNARVSTGLLFRF
ncbi:MAG TPA: hypothetical protein VFI95_17005 [Terriglobales bacterium]|nr:hypothetical protein [Terriglobales bacterium]